MALESPQTYAEWFWRSSLDAQYARSESYEKALSPVLSSLIGNLPNIGELPAYLSSFLNSIITPTTPDWDDVLIRFVADIGAGLAQRVLGHEVKEFDYKVNMYLQNTRINPDVANALMLRKKITPELWLARQQAGGFNEAEGAFLYESQKPYPTMPEIITYARYHGDAESPKDKAWNLYDISPADWDLWEWLSLQKLNTEQVLSLYKRKFMNEYDAQTELARLGWQRGDREALLDLAYTLPNAMLLVQGGLLQGQDIHTIYDEIAKADIHPDYTQIYVDAILTKPATTDIIAYELRQDPSLSNLDRELRKIGIHPNYIPLYKELAYPIPPVADIITMAVREAFTPTIAARFGQYEDLPSEYVSWVGKKGLSREWAERYWAAHWSLPSITQGFEMFQRGVISRDDLYLLLRALDVMPFWRDKLMQISYVPLTRVDIRRMYALGVLSVNEITRAYKDIGYNDENAARLTVFTVKLTEQAAARSAAAKVKAQIVQIPTWTTAQTVSFLKKGLITQDRAVQELTALGYDAEHRAAYLASAIPAT